MTKATPVATEPGDGTNRDDYSSGMEEYQLRKYHAGCTGMFWRSDPTGKHRLASNNNWPRDDAMLRGEIIDVGGEKWLLAKEVKQAFSREWKKAPTGAALPFQYNRHYYLAKV